MKRFSISAVVLALALAGFGCGRPVITPAVTPEPVPAAEATADKTGVEAATSDLIDIAEDEDKLLKSEANDAQELGDDKDEVNAITESSYDLR